MKKVQIANKDAISCGLDRILTEVDGRHINALVIADSEKLEVKNGNCTHVFGDRMTAIVLTVRNDGSPDSILSAINLMIASIGTAQ